MVANPNLPSGQRSVRPVVQRGRVRRADRDFAQRLQRAGCPPVSIANIGDMPAMAIRGPGVNNWNTSLFKNFRVKERLQLPAPHGGLQHFQPHSVFGVGRASRINAAGVNTTTAAGTITSARDPRYLQLALRLMF